MLDLCDKTTSSRIVSINKYDDEYLRRLLLIKILLPSRSFQLQQGRDSRRRHLHDSVIIVQSFSLLAIYTLEEVG